MPIYLQKILISPVDFSKLTGKRGKPDGFSLIFEDDIVFFLRRYECFHFLDAFIVITFPMFLKNFFNQRKSNENNTYF